MRAFFCFELSDQIRTQIGLISSKLKRVKTKVSWVRTDNLHVTLKFLGDIDESQIEELQGVAVNGVSKGELGSPILLSFDRLGAFPSLSKPRVIWVGSSENQPELQTLAGNLETGLLSLGFESEGRPFTPHVTLGRIKDRRTDTSELVSLIERWSPFEFVAAIDQLTLMQSTLSPRGAIYTPIFQIPFGAK